MGSRIRRERGGDRGAEGAVAACGNGHRGNERRAGNLDGRPTAGNTGLSQLVILQYTERKMAW